MRASNVVKYNTTFFSLSCKGSTSLFAKSKVYFGDTTRQTKFIAQNVLSISSERPKISPALPIVQRSSHLSDSILGGRTSLPQNKQKKRKWFRTMDRANANFLNVHETKQWRIKNRLVGVAERRSSFKTFLWIYDGEPKGAESICWKYIPTYSYWDVLWTINSYLFSRSLKIMNLLFTSCWIVIITKSRRRSIFLFSFHYNYNFFKLTICTGHKKENTLGPRSVSIFRNTCRRFWGGWD